MPITEGARKALAHLRQARSTCQSGQIRVKGHTRISRNGNEHRVKGYCRKRRSRR